MNPVSLHHILSYQSGLVYINELLYQQVCIQLEGGIEKLSIITVKIR